jgi:hypothetical protein
MPDLGWLESGMRQAALQTGCRLIEALLNKVAQRQGEEHRRKGERRYWRRKWVKTLLGEFSLQRSCLHDGQGSRVPMDEALGIEGTGYSPGVLRLSSRAGARAAFEEASEDLRVYAGVEVSGREIQRIVKRMGPQIGAWMDAREAEEVSGRIAVMYVSYDGTGVPMAARELRGRKGKDGEPKTREVKVGCVFTQQTVDEKGHPIRDENSTPYVASFEVAETFVARLRQEAIRRRMSRAKQVVVIGDGAAWIWTQAAVSFPGCVEILDIYHAYEHLTGLFRLLFPKAEINDRRLKRWRIQMESGKIATILSEAQTCLPRSGPRRTQARKEIKYFRTHQQRMRYAKFQKQALFIGSGVVEAGCKSLIGARLKQSGMFWTVTGAQHVLNTRCCLSSHAFNAFWDLRRPAPSLASQTHDAAA